MRIILDLDDVLADFTGSAVEIHGWTKEELMAKVLPGQWSIAEVMGLTLNEFWRPINHLGFRFWDNVKPLPWFEDLIDLVGGLTNDWYVVSQPGSRTAVERAAKYDWIGKHYNLSDAAERLILTADKHLFANKFTILVDDRASNIERFKKAGGCGLWFPNWANEPLHQHLFNPMPYVRKLFEGFNQPAEL